MKPITFKHANARLNGGPKADYGTTEDVADLLIYRDVGYLISCWKPSWRDRLRLLFGEPIWLHVWGTTHPPLGIEAQNPFSS